MGINVNDLNQTPLGGDLLSGSESIMGSLRVLSEDELSLSGGGGKGKGKGKGKGGYYPYPCPPPPCGSRCY